MFDTTLIQLRGKPRPSDLVAQQPLGEASHLARKGRGAEVSSLLIQTINQVKV